MKFAQLKDSVEDRVKTLTQAYEAETERLPRDQNRHTVWTLEGRLEEARVILDLINLVDAEREEKTEHPLRLVPSMTFVGEDPDRHDPGRC